jgi:hypothetical protein
MNTQHRESKGTRHSALIEKNAENDIEKYVPSVCDEAKHHKHLHSSG